LVKNLAIMAGFNTILLTTSHTFLGHPVYGTCDYILVECLLLRVGVKDEI